VTRFAAGHSFEQYRDDEQLQWSVERGFEIIGEALSQLRKIDASRAEQVTDWRAIISFRNVLIHGYSAVDHRTTWDIVQSELPTLRREVDRMLSE